MKISNLIAGKYYLTIAAILGTSLSANASGLIYIPMGGENNVLIAEQDNGEIIGKISNLPSVHGLAATPDGKLLLAGSNEAREPGDKAPAKPEGVSAADHAVHHPNQGGNKAANKAANPPYDNISTVSVISTADNNIKRLIDVPGAVHHVAISNDGKYAVVTLVAEGSISIIDLNNFTLLKTIATGDFPNYASFSNDNSRLFVSNAGNNTISVIDMANLIVERNIVVGASPEHIALSNDGKTLYVNNVSDGSVSFISIDDLSISKTVQVGDNLHGVDVSEDDKTVFVAVRGDDKLVLLDSETAEKKEKTLSPSPYHITTIKGTNELYISSADAPIVWVVDQNSLEIKNKIEVGATAHQMVQVKN